MRNSELAIILLLIGLASGILGYTIGRYNADEERIYQAGFNRAVELFEEEIEKHQMETP